VADAVGLAEGLTEGLAEGLPEPLGDGLGDGLGDSPSRFAKVKLTVVTGTGTPSSGATSGVTSVWVWPDEVNDQFP
jgi:hypothetical protein